MENQSSSAALPNSSLFQTWNEFLHALKRSREPFNPWWWIYRLTVAAMNEYVRLPSSLTVLCRRLAPILALALINLVGASYFGVMRKGLIQKRWCPAASSACAWLYVHDSMVSYLWFMIMFHFVQAAYGSPGIVPTESNAESQTWIDAEKEKERVAWYEAELATKLKETKKTVDPSTLQPSPDTSWCKRCEVLRPPRCHHCRSCGVCVLEFDHHCIFLNNCIGYYNYRSFLLTVFFLTVSCWYGVMALYVPFYEPLQEILQEHGGFVSYLTSVWKGDQPFVTYDSDLHQYSRGLLHLPSMDTILSSLWDDSEYRVRVLMEALFPLVLSVGSLLSGFLGMHVKWTTQGLTSLDYRARNTTPIPNERNQSRKSIGRTSLWQLLQNKTNQTTTNPFDRGTPYLNWVHRMGSNPFLLFIPLAERHSPHKVKRG